MTTTTITAGSGAAGGSSSTGVRVKDVRSRLARACRDESPDQEALEGDGFNRPTACWRIGAHSGLAAGGSEARRGEGAGEREGAEEVTAPLSPILASRLKKAAVDNGFDRELARQGDWLVYGSTQCPLTILARHPRRRGLPRRFLSAERCPCARRARNAHGSPAAAGCARRPHGHGPPGAPPAREPRTPAQQDVARRAPPHPRKAVRGIAEEHRYRAPRRPARRPGPVPRGPAGVLGRPVRNHRLGRAGTSAHEPHSSSSASARTCSARACWSSGKAGAQSPAWPAGTSAHEPHQALGGLRHRCRAARRSQRSASGIALGCSVRSGVHHGRG